MPVPEATSSVSTNAIEVTTKRGRYDWKQSAVSFTEILVKKNKRRRRRA